MTAIERRAIKGVIMDTLTKQGVKVAATDSGNIAVFTDRVIEKRTVKIGEYDLPYLTTWGEGQVLKWVAQHAVAKCK